MAIPEQRPTLRARLPRRPDAAPAARIAVTGALPGPLPDHVALVLTEMVANAVAHGTGAHLRLSVTTGGGRARLEVTSRAPRFRPDPAPPGPADVGGRGLCIIDALSDAWGVEQRPLGDTRVWAEVPLTEAA